ncbi:hypothetical protein J4G37_49350, partial [Microvirga sp. 3-52]|nr:hypothetical protein [Microvirga sp. 3-52]
LGLGSRGKRGTWMCLAAPAERAKGVGTGDPPGREANPPPAHGFSALSLALQPVRDEPSEGATARLVAQPQVRRCRRGLEGQRQAPARTGRLPCILHSGP